MVGFCKNCIHWLSNQECNIIDIEDYDAKNLINESSNKCCVIIKVNDDYGLDIKVKTGPNFGCVNFKQIC